MPDTSTPRSAAAAKAARLGMILFIVYVVFYATYVYLSAFCPTIMAKPLLGGVNIAVLYGLGLIIAFGSEHIFESTPLSCYTPWWNGFTRNPWEGKHE
jgi:hypothetical protein